MLDPSGPILQASQASKYAQRWFTLFDNDNDGKLYLDEIRALDDILVKTFNFRQDDDLLIKLLQILDPDQKGYITQKDFEEIIMKYLCHTNFKNANSNYLSKKMANSNVSGVGSYLDLGQYGTYDSGFNDKEINRSYEGKIASSVKSEIMQDENDFKRELEINNIFVTDEEESKYEVIENKRLRKKEF